MDIIALVVGGILLLSLVFSWVMVAQILLGRLVAIVFCVCSGKSFYPTHHVNLQAVRQAMKP